MHGRIARTGNSSRPQVCARFKAFRDAEVGRTAKWPAVARQFPPAASMRAADHGGQRTCPSAADTAASPAHRLSVSLLHGVCNQWKPLRTCCRCITCRGMNSAIVNPTTSTAWLSPVPTSGWESIPNDREVVFIPGSKRGERRDTHGALSAEGCNPSRVVLTNNLDGASELFNDDRLGLHAVAFGQALIGHGDRYGHGRAVVRREHRRENRRADRVPADVEREVGGVPPCHCGQTRRRVPSSADWLEWVTEVTFFTRVSNVDPSFCCGNSPFWLNRWLRRGSETWADVTTEATGALGVSQADPLAGPGALVIVIAAALTWSHLGDLDPPTSSPPRAPSSGSSPVSVSASSPP
jgi:hypothetical protein